MNTTTAVQFTTPRMGGRDGRSLKGYTTIQTHEDGSERRVSLTVSHYKERKGFLVTLTRYSYEPAVAGSRFYVETFSLYQDVRNLALVPVARYSEKALRATYDDYLAVAMDEVAGGWH